MYLDPDTRTWFEETRREWNKRLSPFKTAHGEHVFHVATRIPQSALERTKFYSNRYSALSTLTANGVIAEIGTQKGDFAKFMLNSLRPEKLVCFDLYDEDFFRHNPTMLADPKFELIIGDSSQLLSKFPEKYFDIIYIDGDHSFDGVRRDASVALQCIKDDGVIVFNDYVMWSIRELVDYGVVPTVNEILSTGAWDVVYFALDELMYCDIAIRKK